MVILSRIWVGIQTLDHAISSHHGVNLLCFSVLDDSQSLQLTQDGWYQVKQQGLDFYYLAKWP